MNTEFSTISTEFSTGKLNTEELKFSFEDFSEMPTSRKGVGYTDIGLPISVLNNKFSLENLFNNILVKLNILERFNYSRRDWKRYYLPWQASVGNLQMKVKLDFWILRETVLNWDILCWRGEDKKAVLRSMKTLWYAGSSVDSVFVNLTGDGFIDVDRKPLVIKNLQNFREETYDFTQLYDLQSSYFLGIGDSPNEVATEEEVSYNLNLARDTFKKTINSLSARSYRIL